MKPHERAKWILIVLAIACAQVLATSAQVQGTALLKPEQFQKMRAAAMAKEATRTMNGGDGDLLKLLGLAPASAPAHAKQLTVVRGDNTYVVQFVIDQSSDDVLFYVVRPTTRFAHLTNSSLTLRAAALRRAGEMRLVINEQAAETYQECLRVWAGEY